MLEKDKSINPKVIAYFMKDENDDDVKDRLYVAQAPIKKSNFSRDFQYIHDLKSKSYKFLKIIVPEVTEQDSNYWKNLQISSIRIKKVTEDESPQK